MGAQTATGQRQSATIGFDFLASLQDYPLNDLYEMLEHGGDLGHVRDWKSKLAV